MYCIYEKDLYLDDVPGLGAAVVSFPAVQGETVQGAEPEVENVEMLRDY
jgi:hypothetical protein